MRYELTQDLLTGNNLIDTEHKQLFAAINDLLDACSQGKGREKLVDTDEEKLQVSSNYPGYPPHKTFHDGYKRQLSDATQQLLTEGPTVRALGQLNQMAAVLISHIRTEDRKLAKHLKG